MFPKLADIKYKLEIRDAVSAIMGGYIPRVDISASEKVTVSLGTAGITYVQCMALREAFQAEFDIEVEHTDGYALSEVTWEPGFTELLLTFTKPKETT